MKAIKDCEWEVEITKIPHEELYYFRASASQNVGLNVFGSNLQGRHHRRKYLAKRNWECFAKLNKIEKWKYV